LRRPKNSQAIKASASGFLVADCAADVIDEPFEIKLRPTGALNRFYSASGNSGSSALTTATARFAP
jgi:hypothetical protein